jgi:hypothetical protein
MALAKMYPLLKPESLIRHVKLFLPYFKARIRKFHQNWVVSTDVPRGSRYKQSQDERQRMKDDTHDVYPNISDGGTLLVIHVCHLNVLACLFVMLSFKVSI